MKKIYNTLLLLLIVTTAFGQQWVQKTAYPNTGCHAPSSFTIGSKVYFAFGQTSNFVTNNVLREYDPATSTWTTKAPLPASARYGATAFSINGYGYICCGWASVNGARLQDLWRYDPVADSWLQMSTFPGAGRYTAAVFVINNKAYVGTGYSPFMSDFYMYDPALNTWTQKQNYPVAVQSAASFALNGKGYVAGGGNSSSAMNLVCEYDPALNQWTQKNPLPVGLGACFGVVINSEAYVGMGVTMVTPPYTPTGNIYRYSQAADTWTLVSTFPGTARSSPAIASFGNKGYLLGGANQTSGSLVALSDFWEFTPGCDSAAVITSAGTSICSGAAVQLSAVTYGTYQWRKNNVPIAGATSAVYNATSAGTYKCRITNTCGVSMVSNPVTITNSTIPATPASVSGIGRPCPGSTGFVYSVAPVAGATSYNWTVPNGSFITGGAGTNSITVNYDPSFVSGQIVVNAVNECGISNARTKSVNRDIPGIPSGIAGPAFGVCNQTVTYAISAVSNANTYLWTVPAGASIVSGQGTISVQVNFAPGFVSGSVSVEAGSNCGYGNARTLSVKSVPATPGAVTGPSTVCQNSQAQYSIATVPSALSYSWVKPAGSTFTGASTGNAVTINFTTSGGTVKVRANNACGSGSYSTMNVAVNCREGEFGAKTFAAAITPNPSSASFNLNVTSPQYEICTVNIFDITGQVVYQQQVIAGDNIHFGEELSPGIYIAKITQGSNTSVTRIVKSE